MFMIFVELVFNMKTYDKIDIYDFIETNWQ